jgi:hypothetical protein
MYIEGKDFKNIPDKVRLAIQQCATKLYNPKTLPITCY